MVVRVGMACVRLPCEGPGLVWALLRGFGAGKTAGYPRPGPAVGTRVSGRCLWDSEAGGRRRAHKCAARVGAGGSAPPGPGGTGARGAAAAGALRAATLARRVRGPREGSGSSPARAGTANWSPGPARGRPGAHTRPVTGGGRCGGAASSRGCAGSLAWRGSSRCIRGGAGVLHFATGGRSPAHSTPQTSATEETQHILKVLHSPETPLAEKQQATSKVFGDCRLKIDEGQKSMEKGMKPDVVEVQPSKEQAADDVKQSDPTPEAKPQLFTSSGSSFRFDFTLSETNPDADPGGSGAEQVQKNVRATKQNWNGALRFGASRQEPKFAFNFAIPDEDCPQLQLLPASQHTEHTADPSLSAESAAVSQAAALHKLEVTQVTGYAPKEDRSRVTSKIPQKETAPADEAVTEKSTGDGAAQKKKKKKQKPPVSKKKTEETDTSRKAKAEANSWQNTYASHQDENTCQQSDEQLWKEVDWCVNQLELGLKTQKPTPKQAEEALRAIRTLRSDKAPLVKKRQLMRAMFGDYRKKMQEELCRELKLMEAAAKSARIVELKGSILKKNGQFIRKCLGACRKSQGSAESPSESHRTLNTGLFNFTTPQEFSFNFF